VGASSDDAGARFAAAVARNLDGISGFSVGACPGCASCGLDSDSLPIVGASYRGHPLRVHDEGGSEVYLYVESLGPVGLVRAWSFSDAWDCALDTILDDAPPDDPDIWAEGSGPDAEEPTLAEGFHHRPNGAPTVNGLSSWVASEDLNGAQLVRVVVDPHDVERGVVELRGFGEVEIALDRGNVERARASAEEGGFSREGCDSCGSTLAGDLFPAHYLDAAREIVHCVVCVDCLQYHANGELPESWA
jgi:hypothetical protein